MTDEQREAYVARQIEEEKALARLPEHVTFEVKVEVRWDTKDQAHWAVVGAYAHCNKCREDFEQDADGSTKNLDLLGQDIDNLINDLKIETGRWVASHECEEATEEA
jgi:hypothetical protein